MRRTGDAGVVIADRLLAALAHRIIRQIEPSADVVHEILFDARLVLRGRWHDARFGDGAVLSEPVTVVKQPARCLGGGEPGSRPRLDRHRRSVRLLIMLDDSQSLVAGVKHLDRAHDDAAIRVGAGGAQAGTPRRLLRERRQPLEIEAVAGERPDQVRATAAQARMQRGRAREMDFLEMVVILRGGDVEAAVRDDAALVERIFVRVSQRDKSVVPLALGKVEPSGPAHGFDRCIARPFEAFGERLEFAPARRAVEAADAHIDRMDLAPAEQCHDLVANLLQRETAAHNVAMVAGHVDSAGIAEEIGRMQHVDVQRVALHPLAAVEEAPQFAQRSCHGDTERILHRMHRAHLIGDWTDAADARSDVRRLGQGAAAQKRLEEAGRLEDAEFGARDRAIAHDDLERPLALDAGEIIDLDRLSRHGARFPRGTARHWR